MQLYFNYILIFEPINDRNRPIFRDVTKCARQAVRAACFIEECIFFTRDFP